MKNIFLTGFMGVGKTTVGEVLAETLNYTLIDTDELIEQKLNREIPSIFEDFGEDFFRKTEYQVIKEISSNIKQVISLGGGAYLNKATQEICSKNGVTIHLSMSFNLWKKRIPDLIDSRPLLQENSLEEIESLFNQRQSAYNQADIIVNVDHLTPKEIVQTIKQKIKH